MKYHLHERKHICQDVEYICGVFDQFSTGNSLDSELSLISHYSSYTDKESECYLALLFNLSGSL